MAHYGKGGTSPYDNNGDLYLPGSQHEGWEEQPYYATWYAKQLAHGETEKARGGLGSGFIDIDRIAGGAQQAWEFGQRGEAEAGLVGMGPTDFTYGPGIDLTAHRPSRPQPRTAKPRGT